MKTLYLVRHAKSSWKDPSLSDIERPLNGRGRQNVADMGARLAQKGIMPDTMITSPAKRAHDTCVGIAEALGFPKEKILIERKLYHADEDDFLEIINLFPEDVEIAMLFSHNPGLTWTANRLTGASIDNVPTCGIVLSRFEVGPWEEVGFGKGELVFYDWPKRKQ